jgi:hydroxymethylbilane synthase
LKRKFTIGSRGSDLALWQTGFTKTALEDHFPLAEFDVRIIKTKGDSVLDTALSKIGDKGLFTREIEIALINHEIDLAVHSLKDLPTIQPAGLTIGAVSKRETPNDIFISKNYSSIEDLPKGARVATGSLRRKSQLLHFRPDLEIVEIRGNVPTRIQRLLDSDLDGMILAFAGVHRLGLDVHIKQVIPTEILLPAVGQGVMAVEIRAADTEISTMINAINDDSTKTCITAERAFLRRLEGGCQVPIGAYAVLENNEITLRGFVGNLDGTKIIHKSIQGEKGSAEDLGTALAERCLSAGAAQILAEARVETIKNTGEVIF